MLRRGINAFFDNVRQDPITRKAIEAFETFKPRRFRMDSAWLHDPSKPGNDYCLTLPFSETLENTFGRMCMHVEHIPFQTSKAGKPYTFLKGSSTDPSRAEPVRAWLATVGKYVAIRDCLAVSFALDFDKKDGGPNNPHTRAGDLRVQAKSYNGQMTVQTTQAADALVEEMVVFLHEMTVYGLADAIAAVPPSDPNKTFDLPNYIARKLAVPMQLENLCDAVTTKAKRAQLKNAALADKLGAIEDTIAVDAKQVSGKTILLIEDLYQSGTSINYAAMELLNAGASRVFGLSCVKTCSNSDNVAE